MTYVLVKSVVGPDSHCVNLLDEILCDGADSLTLMAGGRQISFNGAIMCSLSPLLSTLVKQSTQDNCCTVHDRIFVFLPELRNWKTVQLLKMFLSSGMVDNISRVEVDDLQNLLNELGFNISCEVHSAVAVQVEDEGEEEQFFAEIKYEDEDEEELLGKQDLFTRIELKRNDYEEIKNLIASGSSALIGNSGNIDQEMMQDEDLEINQGADANLPTNLGECEQRSHSFSPFRNKTLPERPKRILPNRKRNHSDFEINEKKCPRGETGKKNAKVARKGGANKAKDNASSMNENLNERSGDNNEDGNLAHIASKNSHTVNSSKITGNYKKLYMNCNVVVGNEGESNENKIRLKMKKDSRIKMKVKNYCCSICTFKTKHESDFKRHIQVLHDIARYACEKCDYMTKYKWNLFTHNQAKHEGFRVSCDKCDYESKYKSNLKAHIKSVHEHVNVKYSCNKCDFTSKFKGYLSKHMQTEHDGVSYTCKKCDFVSKYKSLVKRHMGSVHEGIRYACEKCVFKSKEKSKLKIHIQAEHEGIRYACEKCGFETKYKSYFSTHMKVQHEGVRYACEECDYKSKSKSNLSKHMQGIHKGTINVCKTRKIV